MSKVKESCDTSSMLSEAYVLMAGLRTCLANQESKSEEDWQWLQATDHWFELANRSMSECLEQDFTSSITVASLSGMLLAVKDKAESWEKDERLSIAQRMALVGAAFYELLPILEGVLRGYKSRN